MIHIGVLGIALSLALTQVGSAASSADLTLNLLTGDLSGCNIATCTADDVIALLGPPDSTVEPRILNDVASGLSLMYYDEGLQFTFAHSDVDPACQLEMMGVVLAEAWDRRTGGAVSPFPGTLVPDVRGGATADDILREFAHLGARDDFSQERYDAAIALCKQLAGFEVMGSDVAGLVEALFGVSVDTMEECIESLTKDTRCVVLPLDDYVLSFEYELESRRITGLVVLDHRLIRGEDDERPE